ncbi:MAG: hypothetical protein QXR44_04620 [Thermoproteota archaeon]
MCNKIISSCKIILIMIIMLSPNILLIKSDNAKSIKIPLTIKIYPDASFSIDSKVDIEIPENVPLYLDFTSALSPDGKKLTFQLQAQLTSRSIAESFSKVFKRMEIGAIGRRINGEGQAEIDLYMDFNEDEVRFDYMISFSVDEAKAKIILSENLVKAEGYVVLPTNDVNTLILAISMLPQYLRPSIEEYLRDTGIVIKEFSINGISKEANICLALFKIELEGNLTKASEKITREQCVFSPYLLMTPFMPVADEGGKINITLTAETNTISVNSNGEMRFLEHIDKSVESNKFLSLSVIEQIAECDRTKGASYLPLIQRLKNTTISYRDFKMSFKTEIGPRGRILKGDLQILRLRPPLEGTPENFKFTSFIQDVLPLEEELKNQLNLLRQSLYVSDKSLSWSMDVEIICVQETGKKLKITIPSSAPTPQYQNETYARWVNITSISQLKDISFNVIVEKTGGDMIPLMVAGIVIIVVIIIVISIIVITRRKKPLVETPPPPPVPPQ